jgi:hypothetical protein
MLCSLAPMLLKMAQEAKFSNDQNSHSKRSKYLVMIKNMVIFFFDIFKIL